MRPFPSRNGCMKSSSAWTLATSRMSVSVSLYVCGSLFRKSRSSSVMAWSMYMADGKTKPPLDMLTLRYLPANL